MMELKFKVGEEWLIVKKALQASLARNEKELHAILAEEEELTSYKERELAELTIKRDILIKLLAQIA
jgi:hypothetical protein